MMAMTRTWPRSHCASTVSTSAAMARALAWTRRGIRTSTRSSNRFQSLERVDVLIPRRVHRSEEHTSELQSHSELVCRLLLEKKKKKTNTNKQTKQHTTAQYQ